MIVLCGVKHCGKTTLGRLLAKRRNVDFIDLDDELTMRHNQRSHDELSCREIYQQYGEDFFRRLESEVLLDLFYAKGDYVLSLGGGTISNPYVNREQFGHAESVVWLDINDLIAFRRIQQEGLPLFLANSADPLQAFIQQNIDRKKNFSSVATIVYKIDHELPPAMAVQQLENLMAGKKI